MGDDPLDRLLGELLEAHDRLQTDDKLQPAQVRRPRPGRRRTLVLSMLTLAVSASAAAAVVIGTQRSAPLIGALPHQLLGSRYVLSVEPDLAAGHADWCITLLDVGTGASVLPTPSNCVAPSGGPLVGRGGVATISTGTGTVEGWLLYAIVDKRVAALQAPDGTRILPISSPQLPADWRAAVAIQTKPSRPTNPPTVEALFPLNAQGRRLRTSVGKAVVLPTQMVNPNDPPTTGCRIDKSLPNVRLLEARALRAPAPQSLPVTPGFLSCYSLTFDLDGQASTAALLLDSRHPGSRPAALPGTRRMRGQPGLLVGSAAGTGHAVNRPDDGLFAERVKDGWLVIQSSAPTVAVVAVLKHLTAHV
jgi:hypothetical protein